jgi:hypothetical protein
MPVRWRAAVATACGGLPLAVRVAGARLGARPRWRVRDLADQLSAGPGRLDQLDTSRAIRTCFQVSYEALESGSVAMFRLLGRWPGLQIDARTAAALVGDTQRLLDGLVDAHLLDTSAPGRYQIHDLLHEYATELATHGQPPVRDVSRATNSTRGYDPAQVRAVPGAHQRTAHRQPVC